MTEFAREYGEGLYELAAEENITHELMEELKVLRSSFREQPEFLQLLSNRALVINERKAIIDTAFSGRINRYLLNFLKILCERGSLNEFGRCVEVFSARYNSDNSFSVANVTTATPLDENQREKLIARLEKISGHKVTLNEKLDPAVIGGVVLEMDGRRWDNTLKQRLDSIKSGISGRT